MVLGERAASVGSEKYLKGKANDCSVHRSVDASCTILGYADWPQRSAEVVPIFSWWQSATAVNAAIESVYLDDAARVTRFEETPMGLNQAWTSIFATQSGWRSSLEGRRTSR